MEIHVVEAGDSVDTIAAAYGINVEQLIYDNQLIYPYELALGQALFIGIGAREAERAIRVGGYAYPFISRWVLNETLPFLSQLLIFSYSMENLDSIYSRKHYVQQEEIYFIRKRSKSILPAGKGDHRD